MQLKEIFDELFEEFGMQYWWPAESPFEVCIGAILTQNTNWNNVEKAIENLKKENALDLKKIALMEKRKLEQLINPAGFFKQKAGYLQNFCKHIEKNYDSNLELFFSKPLEELRKELLSLKGVGKETADSILLYAAQKPVFMIDAYTKRILSRIEGKDFDSYDELQELFHSQLEKDTQLFNEFHALLVEHAKRYCKKKPLCQNCPLKPDCWHYNNSLI